MLPMSSKNFLTTGQVAERGKVDRTTVHHWAKDGKLPVAAEANGTRLFDEAEVDRFLAERADAEAARKAAGAAS